MGIVVLGQLTGCRVLFGGGGDGMCFTWMNCSTDQQQALVRGCLHGKDPTVSIVNLLIAVMQSV
jgi:hypothetical protein